MNCKNCGAPLSSGVSFCTNCGAKVEEEVLTPVYTPEASEPAAHINRMAEELTAAAVADDISYVDTTPAYQAPTAPVYQAPADPNEIYTSTPAPTPAPAKSPYTIWSIILTIVSALCCCNLFSLVFGILGIVFSKKAANARTAGDILTADNLDKKAKLFCIIGTIFAVTYPIILSIIGAVSGSLTDFINGMGYMTY